MGNGWKGKFRVRGEGVSEFVFNEIQDAGLQMTGDLWTGTTTERFDAIRLSGEGQSVTEVAEFSSTVEAGTLTVTGVATFPSSARDFTTDTVALIGSSGTVIAEAPLTVEPETTVEITREDTLSGA